MILLGDVRETLKTVADGSVQCVVTSPPYWGLRDYGHDGQIGLEQTPDEYVAEMVAVFREIRRVLADDGVLWLNLGDSYAGSGKGAYADGQVRLTEKSAKQITSTGTTQGSFTKAIVDGLKPKDLVGVPWRVALALQADGWWLRQDIIWHKPNPMPESVTDRCTKAHEYMFMLTKSAKYYYDNKAIKEPVAESSLKRAEYGWDCDRPSTKNASMGGEGIHVDKMGTRFVNPEGRNKRSVWTVPTRPFKGAHFATFPPQLIEPCILATSREGDTVLDPFFGAGTTGLVAQRHNRRWIGCELNPDYAKLAEERINKETNLFTEDT